VAKKKHKHRDKPSFLIRLFHVSLPEEAKRLTWSVGMFVLALIFSFAFFGKAGLVGQILFDVSEFLVGQIVFLIPLFFVLTGLVLWGMKEYKNAPVFFAFLLLLLGMSGIVGGVARVNSEDVQEVAGWFGLLVSWPMFIAFGFWVTEIISTAFVLVSAIIFWKLLPHAERSERSSIAQGAQEKVKKLFEPKFKVGEIESEPKVHHTVKEEESESKFKEKLPFRTKQKNIEVLPQPQIGDYKAPPVELLEAEKGVPNAGDIKNFSAIIKKTLQNFDISIEISEVNIGPTVTQYAFKPAEGIKLSRIVGLQNDLSLALAAHPLRIEAPIPGRALVSIEIPNKVRTTVRLRSLIDNAYFKNFPSSLATRCHQICEFIDNNNNIRHRFPLFFLSILCLVLLICQKYMIACDVSCSNLR